MNRLSIDDKVAGCLPFLAKAKLIADASDAKTREYVRQVIIGMQDRLKVFSDILEYDEFFVADDAMPYDEKAFDKRVRQAPESVALLEKFRQQLAQVEPFDAPSLDKLLHEFIAAEGVQVGAIIHALRVAVSGKAKGIGMFDCLAILGRDRSLRRIDQSLARR
jgi:glutamyl-tRNA synthetase